MAVSPVKPSPAISPVKSSHFGVKDGRSTSGAPDLEAINWELVEHASRLESTLRALVLDVLTREQVRVQERVQDLEQEIEAGFEDDDDEASFQPDERMTALEEELAEARQQLSMLSDCEARVLSNHEPPSPPAMSSGS